MIGAPNLYSDTNASCSTYPQFSQWRQLKKNNLLIRGKSSAASRRRTMAIEELLSAIEFKNIEFNNENLAETYYLIACCFEESKENFVMANDSYNKAIEEKKSKGEFYTEAYIGRGRTRHEISHGIRDLDSVISDYTHVLEYINQVGTKAGKISKSDVLALRSQAYQDKAVRVVDSSNAEKYLKLTITDEIKSKFTQKKIQSINPLLIKINNYQEGHQYNLARFYASIILLETVPTKLKKRIKQEIEKIESSSKDERILQLVKGTVSDEKFWKTQTQGVFGGTHLWKSRPTTVNNIFKMLEKKSIDNLSKKDCEKLLLELNRMGRVAKQNPNDYQKDTTKEFYKQLAEFDINKLDLNFKEGIDNIYKYAAKQNLAGKTQQLLHTIVTTRSSNKENKDNASSGVVAQFTVFVHVFNKILSFVVAKDLDIDNFLSVTDLLMEAAGMEFSL